MLAPGAMAWAHSTSKEISKPQSALVVGRLVVLPVWLVTVRVPDPVIPNAELNVARSALMFVSL